MPVASDTPDSLDAGAFGLSNEGDGYRLDVSERTGVGGQAIDVDVTRNGGAPGATASVRSHVFVVGEGFSYFEHAWEVGWGRWMNVGRPGPARVVTIVPDPDGDVVLGADVIVTEPSDFEGSVPNPTHTDVVQSGTVLVRRDGWAFSISGVDPGFGVDRPTWLTVVREDGALNLTSIDRGGDGEYVFDPDLPGPGNYVAVLEVAGAQAFSFFVSVDDAGSVAATGERSDLVAAIEAFVAALDGGDHVAVRVAMSQRCREILPPTLEGELEPNVNPDADYRLMQVVVEPGGDTADVSYRVVEGPLEPGVTPDWSSKRESWVLEDGSWRRNTCAAGYFDW